MGSLNSLLRLLTAILIDKNVSGILQEVFFMSFRTDFHLEVLAQYPSDLPTKQCVRYDALTICRRNVIVNEERTSCSQGGRFARERFAI